MLSDLIRWLTFQILIGGLRTGQSNLGRAYWDLVYVYKYGLPDIIVEPPIPWPPHPQPDPSPMYWNIGHESLLLDIMDIALGDPHPQPNRLRKFLGDNQIRITAAKNLLGHFQAAIPQLEAEIRQLEGLQ